MHSKNNANTREVQYHTSDILQKFINTPPPRPLKTPFKVKYDDAAMHTNPPIAMDSKAVRVSAANEV